MRVLLVTPVEIGSGETITSLHVANQVTDRGGTVRFLSSPYARRFLDDRFPTQIQEFTHDGDQNREIWDSCISEFHPDVVVFADYPLFFFSNGVTPLSNKAEWANSLDGLAASLVTLDHTGFAQRAQGLFFGPPHLSFHYEKLPAIPARMHIMLPCPMHEPLRLPERKGQPFRYWNVPLSMPSNRRQATRQRFLEHDDDCLIFHAVARWAWKSAEAFRTPYYEFLPQVLEYYLSDLPKRVTLVSVNDGTLLQPAEHSKLRIINLDRLSASEYDDLLFASDLMLTDNRISITLGKAVCGLLPCVTLRNSFTFRQLMERMTSPLRDVVKAMEARRFGAIYPYEMFPGGTKEWLDQVQLYRDNTLTDAFKTLEIYGENDTRVELHAVLTDCAARARLQADQKRYVNAVQQLPDAESVLRQIVFGQGTAP